MFFYLKPFLLSIVLLVFSFYSHFRRQPCSYLGDLPRPWPSCPWKIVCLSIFSIFVRHALATFISFFNLNVIFLGFCWVFHGFSDLNVIFEGFVRCFRLNIIFLGFCYGFLIWIFFQDFLRFLSFESYLLRSLRPQHRGRKGDMTCRRCMRCCKFAQIWNVTPFIYSFRTDSLELFLDSIGDGAWSILFGFCLDNSASIALGPYNVTYLLYLVRFKTRKHL